MAIEFNFEIAFGVLTFIVVLATVALSILLYGSLSSECFSCDRKKYTQALADSFFWLALSVTIIAFVLLIFTIYDAMQTPKSRTLKQPSTFKRIMLPLGYMVVLGSVTAMAVVVMLDVKKNLELMSCNDAGSGVSGEEGRVSFKKSKSVCIVAMVLSFVVLLAIVFSLAQAIKPDAEKLYSRFGAAYDALMAEPKKNVILKNNKAKSV